MAESVQGTEKRAPGKFIGAPKMVFGTTTNRDYNPVKVPRHRKYIIERSCGISKINVDPMLRET